MRRYFAYGSNMDAAQMKNRCPQSEKKETVELAGYEFFINNRGVANLRQNRDKKVVGIVYDITEDCEKSLDCFEGVQYETNKHVPLPELDAFCYIAANNEEGKPRDGYLEKIIKAAQDNAFPADYVKELNTWSK